MATYKQNKIKCTYIFKQIDDSNKRYSRYDDVL